MSVLRNRIFLSSFGMIRQWEYCVEHPRVVQSCFSAPARQTVPCCAEREFSVFMPRTNHFSVFAVIIYIYVYIYIYPPAFNIIQRLGPGMTHYQEQKQAKSVKR